MFAIVTWSTYKDVSILHAEDGSPVLFLFRREAEKYAKENVSSNWLVVYLD